MAIDIINKETGEVLTLLENLPDWIISNLFSLNVTECTAFDTIGYFVDKLSQSEEIERKLNKALREIVMKKDFSESTIDLILKAACMEQSSCESCKDSCDFPCRIHLEENEKASVAWHIMHGIPYGNTEFIKEDAYVSLDIAEEFEDNAELPTIKVTVLCCDAMFKGEFESSATIGQVFTELGVPYDPAMDAVSTHGSFTNTDKKLQECAHGDSHMSIMVISKHISRSNA